LLNLTHTTQSGPPPQQQFATGDFSHSAEYLIVFYGTIFITSKLFTVVGCSADRETLFAAKGLERAGID
jgi:hypothetical protein